MPATPQAPPNLTLQAEAPLTSSIVRTLKAVRKYWVSLVAVVLFMLGASLLYSKGVTPAYRSEAMLEIDPSPSQPLGDKENPLLDFGAGGFWDTHEYYETQYKIITSTNLLSKVARDLNLVADTNFVGKPPPGLTLSEIAINRLRDSVKVEPVKNSRLLLLKVEDTDPRRARRICDAIGTAYIDQNLQNAVSATSDAALWLDGQLDHVKVELENNENALHDFKQRNELPSTSINEASNMLRVEMQEYDVALTHTRTRKEELLARDAELSKVDPDAPDVLPASELLSSPFLQSLRGLYHGATTERVALLAEGKGENHPLVKAADERIRESKAALLAEVGNIQKAIERDLDVVRKEEAGEASLFDESRRRAVDLNMKEIEYHRLDRAREQSEKLYGLLIERMKESDLARMMKVNNVRVVDSASDPKSPFRPRVLLNAAVAGLFGLLAGLALVLLRDHFDTSLKVPDDVEKELGVTFLGLLPQLDESEGGGSSYGYARRRRGRRRPKAAKGALELWVHERPLSGLAEAARSLRTNLTFASPDRPFRTILVSSAAPSEGKTTVACSIAIAFAQAGQRVCIIDCDLRRPRLHRIFNRVGDAGVTGVLVGEATVDEVAKATDVANLWSIPAGALPPNPADILQSESFRQFLKDVASKFDRVVVDSPPLVAVTDAAILATMVDTTLFVVRAFKTSKHASIQGLRSLQDVGGRVVGAVLNAVDLNRHEYTYYYHYYYYKREGYRAVRGGNDEAARESSAGPPN